MVCTCVVLVSGACVRACAYVPVGRRYLHTLDALLPSLPAIAPARFHSPYNSLTLVNISIIHSFTYVFTQPLAR